MKPGQAWFRGRHPFGLVLVVLMSLAGGCARSSDEQQLRAALAAMQQAVERREPNAFMEHVAEDFSAPAAGMERRQLHDLLRLQVLRNERIGVATAIRDIRIDGNRATVDVTATFTGSSGGWVPERGSIYTLTSGWRRDDGRWKLVQATWERSL